MKVKQSDRYSLKCDVSAMTDLELRNTKFSLNYRWVAHMQKGHHSAAQSAKLLTDTIRAELAQRVQDRQLNDALKGSV